MPFLPYIHEKSKSSYDKYYSQTGDGIANVFQGSQIQKGYGLGSMLTSLAKSAIPLLKRGAVALGKTALQTGVNLANDGLNGKNMSNAARDRFSQFGSDLFSNLQASHNQGQRKRKQSQRNNKKRKHAEPVGSNKKGVKRARKSQKLKYQDIFSS